MIECKIKGHVLRLTDAEWKNIQHRFNPANACVVGQHFYIRVSCKLCAKYKKPNGNCSLCPFLAFAPGGRSNGCLTLLEEIFPAQRFNVNVENVKWRCSLNSYARSQLNSIQKRMKKIEEKQ